MQLIAYVHVLGNRPGKRIGKVVFYETGYYPSYYDHIDYTPEQVKDEVACLNAQIGIPDDVAESAALGSLFGWHVPAAQKAIEFFKQEVLKNVCT